MGIEEYEKKILHVSDLVADFKVVSNPAIFDAMNLQATQDWHTGNVLLPAHLLTCIMVAGVEAVKTRIEAELKAVFCDCETEKPPAEPPVQQDGYIHPAAVVLDCGCPGGRCMYDNSPKGT